MNSLANQNRSSSNTGRSLRSSRSRRCPACPKTSWRRSNAPCCNLKSSVSSSRHPNGSSRSHRLKKASRDCRSSQAIQAKQATRATQVQHRSKGSSRCNMAKPSKPNPSRLEMRPRRRTVIMKNASSKMWYREKMPKLRCSSLT